MPMEIAQKLESRERTEDVITHENSSFDGLLLTKETLLGLKNCGFVKPSPIQLKSIPLGKCGFDLILDAKSGTGKTAVFSIVALEMLIKDGGLQVLILTPTREIASQTGHVLRSIGKAHEGLGVEVVIGGTSVEKDIERLKSNKFQILIGSPGRVVHYLKSGIFSARSIRLFVLDEADMLLESFQKDVKFIHSYLPNSKQTIAASATYSNKLLEQLHKYMCTPSHIRPNATSVLIGVVQHYILVPSHENIVRQSKIKFEKLLEIISKISFKQCLVFCKYQSRAKTVCDALHKLGWPVEVLAGCLNQSERLRSLEKLQLFSCRILIATDLAARGIDASNVDMVINLDISNDCATYLHRIGRAGRYGSKGLAVTILSHKEEKSFKTMLSSLGNFVISPLETISIKCDDSVVSKLNNENVDIAQKSNTKEIKNNTFFSLMTTSKKTFLTPQSFEKITESLNKFEEQHCHEESDLHNAVVAEKSLLDYIKSEYNIHTNRDNCFDSEQLPLITSVLNRMEALNINEKSQSKDLSPRPDKIKPENMEQMHTKHRFSAGSTYSDRIVNGKNRNKKPNKTMRVINNELNFQDYWNWRARLNIVKDQIEYDVYIRTLLENKFM